MQNVVARSLARLALAWLALGAAGCATPFEAPRQQIPAVRFEPVTEATDPSALQRLNEDRLSAAKQRFRDLDPKGWEGTGPWWLRYTSLLVTWVDGQTVLIAVGAVDEGADAATRHAAAAERARAEAERAFQSVLGKVLQTRAKPVPLPADARLRRVAIDAFFEHGPRTWALALCDRDCLEASGRAARVNLSGVALQPGEP
jgi:hypothetical protein